MKKVLITGSEGFIGKYLIDELRDRKFDVFGIDTVELSVSEIQYSKVSLLDKENLKKVIRELQPDVVVHLAAIASVTHTDISEIYSVNICGTENLLDVLKSESNKKVRMILMSTAGVYGNQDTMFYDETLPFNPGNHYSYSKMITEFMCKRYEEWLDIKVVRPFNIIGNGQKRTFLIPKLVECFSKKVSAIQLGNISSVRDYISVDYCAYVIAELVEREDIDFNVLNVCSGIGHSGEDALNFLQTYTGHIPQVEIASSFVRSGEVWRLVGNPDRLLTVLRGYKGKTFEDILVEMLEE